MRPENGWSRNAKVKINITIKAPAYVNLDMEVAYGDLFIQEVTGLALLDLKYSNIKAGELSRGNAKPYNQLEMAYSNGTIDVSGWMELELAYSDVEFVTSEMLFVESKYSKVTGEKVGGIVTEGAYDKYFIDRLSIRDFSNYFKLTIEQLEKELDEGLGIFLPNSYDFNNEYGSGDLLTVLNIIKDKYYGLIERIYLGKQELPNHSKGMKFVVLKMIKDHGLFPREEDISIYYSNL